MYGAFTLPPQVQTEVSVCSTCSAMVLDPVLHEQGAHPADRVENAPIVLPPRPDAVL